MEVQWGFYMGFNRIQWDGKFMIHPLVICYMAIKHGMFIVDLPILHKDGDIPYSSCVNVYQRLGGQFRD